MIGKLFSGGDKPSRGLAASVWPRARIEAGIAKRFGEVRGPHLRDDYVLFGILDGDVAFAIVLHHAAGKPKDIDQIIFYTRFEGFGADGAAAAAMNRNLHLAAVQLRDTALDVFAGIEPKGEFTDAALNAAFDAWKRDLTVVLGMLTGEASFASAFRLDRDPAVASFATNSARTSEAARDLFASFVGPGRSAVACGVCNGRGKTGFISRECDACGGSGMLQQRR